MNERPIKGRGPASIGHAPVAVAVDANGHLFVTGSGTGGATQVELIAGEAHIGEVSTIPPIDIVVTPTITAGAYTAGDAIGGILEFADVARIAGSGGRITKVVVTDDAQQLAPIDLVFFNQTFTPTADNSPFDPSDADLQNCIGHIVVAATDYSSYNDNASAVKCSGLTMPLYYDLATGGTSLFAQCVIRSAPTYIATDDLTIKITVERF